jgi:hypothetical protein
VLGLACLSCTFVDGALRPVEGRYINEKFAAAILDGRTTAEELRKELGEPLEVRESASGQFWRYYSIRTAVSTERILFVRRRHHFTEEQELTTTINRQGIVVAHEFTRNSYLALPRQSLAPRSIQPQVEVRRPLV